MNGGVTVEAPGCYFVTLMLLMELYHYPTFWNRGWLGLSHICNVSETFSAHFFGCVLWFCYHYNPLQRQDYYQTLLFTRNFDKWPSWGTQIPLLLNEVLCARQNRGQYECRPTETVLPAETVFETVRINTTAVWTRYKAACTHWFFFIF